MGLYTGSVYETTEFNVLATRKQTNCTLELTQKVTITITDPASRISGYVVGQPHEAVELVSEIKPQLMLYPNPNTGEFDLEISDDYSGVYTIQVQDLSGKTWLNQMLQKDGKVAHVKIDLRPAQNGFYILSVYHGNSLTRTKLAITSR